MCKERRYIGYIEDIGISIDLDSNELTSFISHFGKFGNILIYDRLKEEIIIKTKGVYIQCFYPDISDRSFAEFRARDLYSLLKDSEYHMRRKYPKKRLRPLYKMLKEYYQYIIYEEK